MTFNIREFLNDENVRAVIRYLAAYREIEKDLGTLDELRRVSSIQEFTDVISRLIRVKPRILDKIVRESDRYSIPIEEGDLRKLFDVSETNICRLYDYAMKDTSLTGKLLATLTYASNIIRAKG